MPEAPELERQKNRHEFKVLLNDNFALQECGQKITMKVGKSLLHFGKIFPNFSVLVEINKLLVQVLVVGPLIRFFCGLSPCQANK